jgi:hypothetical protein
MSSTVLLRIITADGAADFLEVRNAEGVAAEELEAFGWILGIDRGVEVVRVEVGQWAPPPPPLSPSTDRRRTLAEACDVAAAGATGALAEAWRNFAATLRAHGGTAIPAACRVLEARLGYELDPGRRVVLAKALGALRDRP